MKLDADSKIYIFGSRVNDSLKGGDIDILILSDKLTFNDKLAIKKAIFEKLEEQKIDIIIARDTKDPFVRMAEKKGIKLS